MSSHYKISSFILFNKQISVGHPKVSKLLTYVWEYHTLPWTGQDDMVGESYPRVIRRPEDQGRSRFERGRCPEHKSDKGPSQKEEE